MGVTWSSFLDLSSVPGPLEATLRIHYLCYRAAVLERSSSEFSLSPKRLVVLGTLAWFLPMLSWWHALGFFLDDVFFPGYRSQKIEAPIFIQGGARTGTTTLHRLLAKDPQLTTMSTWEMAFATSVAWRRLFAFLRRADALVLRGFGASIVERLAKRVALATTAVHEVQFFGAEEDEWLMAHIGAAQLLCFFFPVVDDFGPLIEWDDRLPERTKEVLLQYYTSCVQRHLFAHGGQLTYVAKNPTFNKRLRWLQSAFPDARFVLMTRSPRETVPSLVSYIGAIWNLFCTANTRCPMARALTDMQPGDICYPVDMLKHWPATQRAVVENKCLRKECREAVGNLYAALGMTVGAKFEVELEAFSQESQHASKHAYSIADTGMSTGEFEAHFAKCTERLQRLEDGKWE